MTIAPTIDAATAAGPMWDTIVIGAGPAGALAARQLALAGLRALLVERRAFPRFKVCGSCLSPRALRVLEDVGLRQRIDIFGGVPLQAFHVHSRGRSARLSIPGGLAVLRESFDAVLVQAAIEAGAEFLPESVAVVEGQAPAESRSRRVRITTSGQPSHIATTRIVLAADGLGHPSLVRCGEFCSAVAADARIGIGTTLYGSTLPCRSGTIHMTIGRAGYVGMVRVEDGTISIAAALDPQAIRAANNPGSAVVALLREAGCGDVAELQDADWRGTTSLRRQTRPLAASSVFVLGDAAGYVEPFTGEGIAWALSAAVEVAPLVCRAIDGWNPALVQEWTAILRGRIWRRQGICRALAWAVRSPRAVAGALAVLGRFPSLACPVLRRLNPLPAHLLESSR